MIVDVTAAAFDRRSGRRVSDPRTERLDTSQNDVVRDAATLGEVVVMFEAFWKDGRDEVRVLKAERAG